MDFPRLLIVLAFFIILIGIIWVSALLGFAHATGWGSDENHKYCDVFTYNATSKETTITTKLCKHNA